MRAPSCCRRGTPCASAWPKSAATPMCPTCSLVQYPVMSYQEGRCAPVSLKVRIIPCLDVDTGRVVKGTNFTNLRDAGDPVELAALYDREGADEIVFYDITATHEQR